jgi:hypothetical protein
MASGVLSGAFSAVGASQPFGFGGWSNASIWGSYNTGLTTTANSSSATVGAAGAIAIGDTINSADVPPGTTVGNIAGTTVTMAFPTKTFYGVLDSAGNISGLASTAGLLGAAVSGPNISTGAVVLAIVQPAIPANSNAPAGYAGQAGIVKTSIAPSAISPTNTPQPFAFALTNASVTAGVDANALFTGPGIAFVGTVLLERSFDGGSTWLNVTNPGATGGTFASYTADVSLSFFEPERGCLYRFNCVAYTSGVINYRLSASGNAALSMQI